ncbi:hypothetical protein DENSPDRAFT_149911 [Dentipellis sp. KUC8613]|nr:hypothetical protein DENSPDRAFT_149911 [Dentipellis sp. KUC8613]
MDGHQAEVKLEDDSIVLCSKHPTLFFNDGSVILRAENTLFCVQRSHFASQSDQLRELLTPDEQYTLWDVLFINLHGDRADDVAAFIESIYGRFYMTGRQLNTETFPKVAGVLRMSAKYGVARLRDAVVTLLKARWPSAPNEYTNLKGSLEPREQESQAMLAQARARARTTLRATPQATDQGCSTIHPALVIALLREVKCGDTSLLAALFYDLSRRSWDLSENALESLEPLSAADRERYILGVTKLRVAYVLESRLPPPTISITHIHTEPCTTGLNFFFSRIAKDLRSADAEIMADPMGGLQAILDISWKDFPRRICPECHSEFLSNVHGLQQRQWNGLEELFCL